LFAHIDASQIDEPEAPLDVDWCPPPGENVALVLDLPSSEGVLAGIALARRGYRPVPLYNAVAAPSGQPIVDPLTGKPLAAVNVLAILRGLSAGAGELARLKLPADAPPAFLLDANRRGDGRKVGPGEFDNRSLSFTTDFPSAIFLASHGIRRAMLLQSDRIDPQPDLAHTLRRWQDGGLKLERLRLDPLSNPESFTVPRPPWYGAIFQRALCWLGLRRSSGGGFGRWVPESSAGG
jgi:hypothetical protein